MNLVKSNSGQFIPISLMIMFTMVILMVAVVNVYKVARAQLQIQNIADAAALNLASQHAQAFNLIADKNEWLNHMSAGIPSPNDPDARADIRNCSAFHGLPMANKPLPPVQCIENSGGPLQMPDRKLVVNSALVNNRAHPIWARHIFHSRDGAINYGMVVHTVNQAQKLFVEAYNSFLGAPGPAQTGGNTARNFTTLLKNDIKELGEDPNIRLIAWNSATGESAARSRAGNWDDNMAEEDRLKPVMDRLEFKVEKNLETRFYRARGNNQQAEIMGRYFTELMYGCVNWNTDNSQYRLGPNGRCGPLHGQPQQDVGWLKPSDNIPRLRGSGKPGVGVLVEKKVSVPILGTKVVKAEARAVIVESASGGSQFKPVYWVKLGN